MIAAVFHAIRFGNVTTSNAYTAIQNAYTAANKQLTKDYSVESAKILNAFEIRSESGKIVTNQVIPDTAPNAMLEIAVISVSLHWGLSISIYCIFGTN